MSKVNITECQHDLPGGLKFPNGVAIDTETLGLNIKRDRLCLVQLCDGNNNVWLVKFDGKTWDAPNLCKILEDDQTLKLYHFGRFDIATMYHYLGAMSAGNYCTKIASKLTRTYTDKHGLKALVEEFTGVSISKEEQCSDWAAPELTDAQKHYAASDVLYLHKIRAALNEKLRETDRMDLAQQCFKFLPTRVQLDLNGWAESDIFSH